MAKSATRFLLALAQAGCATPSQRSGEAAFEQGYPTADAARAALVIPF